MTRTNCKFQILFFIASLFLSSCATILNGPAQRVFISTDRNIKAVSLDKDDKVDSTFIGINSPGIYYVARSDKPLKISLQTGSIRRSVFLKAKKSFAYWSNIYCNYGVGLLVDKNTVKKFAYKKRNYFTYKDTSVSVSRFAPIQKGTINLSLSLPIPFGNIFDIKKAGGQYHSIGVLGFAAGLDYFYRDNHYLSLDAGVATDVFAEHIGRGYYETGGVIFASVQNNNVVGSFDFGYGLNLSQFKWTNRLNGDTIKIAQSLKNTGLGLSLSAQYRLGNYLRIGVLYQPCIINTSLNPVFDYQHYISINLTWKIPVIKAAD